ncbi:MAG: ATP-dependent DNA helicase RecG, partial [Endomicrobiales bacterium]|nr:ATP-dependent DNA helicase RecG [Endomicrobiales bacterium]
MLDKSIQYLKGIGPKRSKILGKIGIFTVRDLISHFPRDYDDRRKIAKIASIKSNEKVTLSTKSEYFQVISLNRNLSAFKVALSDGTGIVFGTFFRKINPYHKHDIFARLKNDFVKGNHVLVQGQAEYNFGEKQIKIEEYEVIDPKTPNKELIHFNRIVPVYPLTEGINQKWLREIIRSILEEASSSWPEVMPSKISAQKHLIPSSLALKKIHFPNEVAEAQKARQKLALDEFLVLETALTLVKKKNKQNIKSRNYAIKKNLLTPFRTKLGFEFTHEQKKCINEIFSNLQKPSPMNRLLLGDVGSGKTAVALSSILLAIENNYQTALLAPTEILAEQHYLMIQELLSGLPVNSALLTGKLSSSGKEKKDLLQKIAQGGINLVIGTHALLEEKVKFKNLGLIVIDEQHRFGVMQRARLHKKASLPDVLVMTATPIPRTLALTVYGDLDISTINALPPGRQPIITLHLNEESAYNQVKQEIKKGHQAYIVYPLVEESDKLELKSATEEAARMSISVFRDFKVGLLHGQMPTKIKEKTMLDFKNKKFDILISTTVIEVGIDVPNATVMVIEHADRFGLATLHQLRGRVGRGTAQSYCILLGIPRTDDAKRRIKTMTSTCDGFKIAEEDLAIRGPGEFFGIAQHGAPPLKAGNILTDVKLIEEAKSIATNIMDSDPDLLNKQHAVLRNELIRNYQ